jgi:hypothetical protein
MIGDTDPSSILLPLPPTTTARIRARCFFDLAAASQQQHGSRTTAIDLVNKILDKSFIFIKQKNRRADVDVQGSMWRGHPKMDSQLMQHDRQSAVEPPPQQKFIGLAYGCASQGFLV